MEMKLAIPIAGLAAFAMMSPLSAAAEDFYEGKDVSVLTGYDPGGGADTIARIFTNHWQNHLPGASSMVVQNMTGAGGAKALNYIYEAAEPDGSTIIYQPWNPIGYITKAPGSRADYTEMEFIGGGSVAKIAYASAKTVDSVDDLLNRRIKLAGSHPTANLDLIARSALEVLGVDYNYVTGYNSTSKSSLAVEQGEIDLDTASGPFFARRLQPVLMESGAVIVPWYYPTVLADGTILPIQYLEDAGIPSFYDVYKEVKGEEPDGLNWELFKYLQVLTGNMLFAAFAPPGTPEEAVAALRESFAATTKDKAYLEEAAKFGEIQFVTVEDGLAVIDSLGSPDPNVLEAVDQLIKSGTN